MQITINLSNDEVACLKNDLLDIEDWVNKAVQGKVNKCKQRFIKEWQPKLFNDPDVRSIPASESEFISLVLSRPDYKDRVARESG